MHPALHFCPRDVPRTSIAAPFAIKYLVFIVAKKTPQQAVNEERRE
jgi:hypothetical protein